MDSSSLVGDPLSPESTVTSLLSSSGHLRSSLLPPEDNTIFRYRDKTYDSASEALDAYIADYEMHRHNSGSQTGRLVLHHMPLTTPRRHRMSTLRNRDVLRESLTDRELDFLKLPVSSLRHRDNRDRLSMTTDELLSIPYDGSMPITHTSAFIQGLMSKSGASHNCCSSSRLGHGTFAQPSSNHTSPQLNHHHTCQSHMPKSCRCRGKQDATSFKTIDDTHSCAYRAAGLQWEKRSSLLHLPHWFTSNKTDLNCSSMSSASDPKYQHCELSEPLPHQEFELWEHPVPRTRAPSWVAELEDDDSHRLLSQVGSQQILRDLRLQFAEQISLMSTERKNSDVVETLFRDNRIESLIQKADQVLNSLSQSSGQAADDLVSPVKTEDLLLSSPSHLPLFSLDPKVTAGGAAETESANEAQALGSIYHGNSIWKQPGPVEALKQMLFKLQAVEAELQRQEQEASAAPAVSDLQQKDDAVASHKVSQRPDSEAELDCFSGGVCLQRALHHLNRLKLLVEEPRTKHRQELVKEEDEGHYSSSSADGLCIQQKPT